MASIGARTIRAVLSHCHTVLIDNGNETKWNFSPERVPDYFARDFAEAAQMILQGTSSATVEALSLSGGVS